MQQIIVQMTLTTKYTSDPTDIDENIKASGSLLSSRSSSAIIAGINTNKGESTF